jgi:hypothetical protein
LYLTLNLNDSFGANGTAVTVVKPGHKALSHEAVPYFEITLEEGRGDDLTILSEVTTQTIAEVSDV